MNANDAMRQSRRGFLGAAGVAAASMASLIMGGLPLAARAADSEKMKIGIAGSGRMVIGKQADHARETR